MIAFIFDFVEPFVLLSMYCRNRGRGKRKLRGDCCYGFCKRAAYFYSWLCFTLISMSLAACWAIAQEIRPPDLRFILPDGCTFDCTASGAAGIPPPAPPPQSPLLPPGELYLLYSLCGLAALVKLISYWNGIPPIVLTMAHHDAICTRMRTAEHTKSETIPHQIEFSRSVRSNKKLLAVI